LLSALTARVWAKARRGDLVTTSSATRHHIQSLTSGRKLVSRHKSRVPEILVNRNPETPKALSPRPLPLVLNVILVDLQPVFAKGD